MQQREFDQIMRAMEGVLTPTSSDQLFATRLDIQEKLLARSFMMSIGGSILAFFLSVQTIFVTLMLTGDIHWNWWSVFIPTAVMTCVWFVVNHIRKQQAKKMIASMQKDIQAIKTELKESPDLLSAAQAFEGLLRSNGSTSARE